MFRIPEFYKVEMTFEEAKKLLERLTMSGGLLEGMQYVDARWEDHCNEEDVDDEEFYETWCYEVSAFNIIHKKMQPLFA